ncbi:MAG: hypothetical protein JJ872_04005 [Marivivens sp.]|jgi:hypothetical protein|nr:hypothetical protein [Marivivens sp.]
MNRRLFIAGAPLALVGCGAAEPVWAPDEQVARSVYRHPGPPSLTLYTVRNVGSDSGAHTGLMINASQRVMWDPAGTFKHETFPERNDVIFGITPQIERIYRSYHARETYYIEIMELVVSAETAERVLQLVMAYGAVPKAQCTISTTTILKEIPQFAHFRVSFFPEVLAEQFGAIPGVRRSEYWEQDEGQNLATDGL